MSKSLQMLLLAFAKKVENPPVPQCQALKGRGVSKLLESH